VFSLIVDQCNISDKGLANILYGIIGQKRGKTYEYEDETLLYRLVISNVGFGAETA